VKSKNMHIIKLLNRFQPNFAHSGIPPNTRRVWSKSAQNKSKMADGRHFEKSLNRRNSAMVTSIFTITKFGKMTHVGRLVRLYRPYRFL